MAPEIIDLTLSSPRHNPILVDSDVEAINLPSTRADSGQATPQLNEGTKKRKKKKTKRPVTDNEYAGSTKSSSLESLERPSQKAQKGRKSLLERLEEPPAVDNVTPEEGEILDDENNNIYEDDDGRSRSNGKPESSKKKRRTKKRKKTEPSRERSPSGNDAHGQGDERERAHGHDNRTRKRDGHEDKDKQKAPSTDKHERQTSSRRRSPSPGAQHRDKRSKHSSPEPNTLFFVDVQKVDDHTAEVIAASISTAAVADTTMASTGGLLLPSHVTVLGEDEENTAEILPPPADETSEDENFIEFLAYDDDRNV